MSTDPITWSAEAEEAHREAQGRRRSYQKWYAETGQKVERIMDHGPFLDEDAGMIVIPSCQYHPGAREICLRRGFSWTPETKEWRRTISHPFEGKVYTARGWLAAARRMYRELWPHWRPDNRWEVMHWTDDEWAAFLSGGDLDTIIEASLARRKAARKRVTA